MCVLDRYSETELGLCVVRLPYSSLSVAGLDTRACPWPVWIRVRCLGTIEASQRGLIFRSEIDTCPTDAISNDINNPASIDATTSPSIDATTSPSIENGRISEQKEFDVCGNLFDGETTTKSRLRSRCFSQPFAKLRALLIAEMIDKGEESMDEAFTQE
ncbi:hypothetical protein DY000_02008319 [Brassica cretica]|uniref:Uncharacterized protein n=1 Tax=Brassica cretica TaxID=69181 RepID=A0ABQ7C0R4_BRACR|nr:hypothetical protein DY000_02008319 [Brassica cretica]